MSLPALSVLMALLSIVLLGPLDARISHNQEIKNHNYRIKRGYKMNNLRCISGLSSGNGYDFYDSSIKIFDVLSFQAKGDGVADDSKAFLAAWERACSVESAIIEVPSKFRFLIGPITLQGPCKPGLVLQIDGTIIALSNLKAWPKLGLLEWINFKWIQGFTVQGTGTIDGQGSAWWKISKYNPVAKPTAMRFYASYNLNVSGIRIQNSPLSHLKFDNCMRIMVSNLTISSPGDSPNTDGIHLQNSQDVELQNSSISCGDDCVSIQTGCSDIYIHHINCGPGHGISLGGLGKDNSLACVSNITAQNITMQDTLYGVRIKTWQGGFGSVKGVSFSNIQVSNVMVPIAIDQFYCDKRSCPNRTNAVAISDIKFNQINGSFSSQAIFLACSNNIPCTTIEMANVVLAPSTEARGLKQAFCWNCYGESQAPMSPTSIDCLETTKPNKMLSNLSSTLLSC